MNNTELPILFQPLLRIEQKPKPIPSSESILCKSALPWSLRMIDVPLGQTGVLVVERDDRERIIENFIIQPGRYMHGTKEWVVLIDTSRKLFDEEFAAETNEGFPAKVGVSMFCRLRPEYAPVFYRSYNSVDFTNVLLRPCLRTCIDRVVSGVGIASFATREQASNDIGKPLQQLIGRMADGIGMDFENLHTTFSPPQWQRELAQDLASHRLMVEIAEMRRQAGLLDGKIEAEIARQKHEAGQPTDTELELARIQAGAGQLREQLNSIQQLLEIFLHVKDNPYLKDSSQK